MRRIALAALLLVAGCDMPLVVPPNFGAPFYSQGYAQPPQYAPQQYYAVPPGCYTVGWGRVVCGAPAYYPAW